jgi:quercetin dioxygenase-like cupin family protein
MAADSARGHFFNIDNLQGGIARKLADGMDARIFVGENAMISLVQIEAGAKGKLHSHPQEQWGLLLEGSGLRTQGGEVVAVKKGDFWQTLGNVEHTFEAGPNGAKVLDIFSPPRDEYRSAGDGFGEDT